MAPPYSGGYGHHNHTLLQNWVALDPLKLAGPIEAHLLDDRLEVDKGAALGLDAEQLVAVEVDGFDSAHGGLRIHASDLRSGQEARPHVVAGPGVQVAEKAGTVLYLRRNEIEAWCCRLAISLVDAPTVAMTIAARVDGFGTSVHFVG